MYVHISVYIVHVYPYCVYVANMKYGFDFLFF